LSTTGYDGSRGRMRQARPATSQVKAVRAAEGDVPQDRRRRADRHHRPDPVRTFPVIAMRPAGTANPSWMQRSRRAH